MTVSGLTMISADRQSAQALDNHAQKTRSATVNFGRLGGAAEHTDLVSKCQDLHLERTQALQASDYTWEIGRIQVLGIAVGLPYLIGHPLFIP